jgi:hypothetical protein
MQRRPKATAEPQERCCPWCETKYASTRSQDGCALPDGSSTTCAVVPCATWLSRQYKLRMEACSFATLSLAAARRLREGVKD